MSLCTLTVHHLSISLGRHWGIAKYKGEWFQAWTAWISRRRETDVVIWKYSSAWIFGSFGFLVKKIELFAPKQTWIKLNSNNDDKQVAAIVQRHFTTIMMRAEEKVLKRQETILKIREAIGALHGRLSGFRFQNCRDIVLSKPYDWNEEEWYEKLHCWIISTIVWMANETKLYSNNMPKRHLSVSILWVTKAQSSWFHISSYSRTSGKSTPCILSSVSVRAQQRVHSLRFLPGGLGPVVISSEKDSPVVE